MLAGEMKLDAARDELKAARFFSHLLHQEQARPQYADEGFRYIFQAFLNAMYMVEERIKNQVLPILDPQGRMDQMELENTFNHLRRMWSATLTPEEMSIWRSMWAMRRFEVHQGRTERVQTAEAMPARPLSDSPIPSERGWAFAVPYIDVYQAQGPGFYVNDQAHRHSYSELVQVTVRVHRFTAHEQREVVEMSAATVTLLQRLVDHFERLYPTKEDHIEGTDRAQ